MAERDSRTIRRPRGADDAILDVEWSRDEHRPDPEWVKITRYYEGEGNAVEEVGMTLAEFNWLVGLAGDLTSGGEG